VAMSRDAVSVEVRGILPANSGCAVFIGNEEKVFVIQVEHNMGAVIGMFLNDTPKERPLTHDLIGLLIKEVEANLVAVRITNLEEGVFYATLDINGKITGKRSVDSRPSDAIAVGLRMQAPIMIAEKLFDEAGIEDEDDEIPGETSTSLSVKELEDRLQVAVEGEKYEIAAKIRDQIKELKH